MLHMYGTTWINTEKSCNNKAEYISSTYATQSCVIYGSKVEAWMLFDTVFQWQCIMIWRDMYFNMHKYVVVVLCSEQNSFATYY